MEAGDILVSMEYNFSEMSNLKDKIITTPTDVPISLSDFRSTTYRNNNEDKYYLKVNTTMYKDEYKKIDYITKNPNRDDQIHLILLITLLIQKNLRKILQICKFNDFQNIDRF